MNFNLSNKSHDNEYKLFKDTSEELINLYGIKILYIRALKIQQDRVFGEHQSIKTPSDLKLFDLYAMPENTDNWDGGFLYNQFGLDNVDVLNLYISFNDMEKIYPNITSRESKLEVDDVPNGDLIQLDNSKIMEVTSWELASASHGNNNVFTSDRDKNVYKLSTRTYIFNHDDIKNMNDKQPEKKVPYESFGNLETIFGDDSDLKDFKDDLKAKATETKKDTYIKDKKPLVSKTQQKNPFGELG